MQQPRKDGSDDRLSRDQANVENARRGAECELSNYRPAPIVVPLHGPMDAVNARRDHTEKRLATLEAIKVNPFHAMMEVVTETRKPNGNYEEKQQLWYANKKATANEVLPGGVTVLSWTHPGVQLALSARLGDIKDVRAHGYTLASVEATARARFDAVLPEISGLYEPGGAVRRRDRAARSAGLREVKLDMLPAQVEAFLSRMEGLMVVSGAPGSGKTTVAFQRIRFLFDQQDLRIEAASATSYAPELTRVFLANVNLVDYSRNLLVRELEIPADVVVLVQQFIADYLDQMWLFKNEARPRQRKLAPIEVRARQAYFGLLAARDLKRCWQAYEEQICERLRLAKEAPWVGHIERAGDDAAQSVRRFVGRLELVAREARSGTDPLRSTVSMDALYMAVREPYETLRPYLRQRALEQFDELLQHWLYWVYDPLDALARIFLSQPGPGLARIRRGTGARASEEAIAAAIATDFRGRIYGPEQAEWLAWLLRFALHSSSDPQGRNRFRGIPAALAPVQTSDGQWTHIVIDEAQDLSVAEASLLGSLVHPRGALTVSADFHQVVLPVHGMTDAEAFKIGCPLVSPAAQIFPFARNMRQSLEIGRFVKAFHQAAFGETASFDVNSQFRDKPPQLHLAKVAAQPDVVRQLLNALHRSDTVRAIALLQVNEDGEEMQRFRAALAKHGVALAPEWQPFGPERQLVTTSVERCKGLEFDACFVLGLDQVERSSLNFAINRAYVAISRPARRLALICEDFPTLLRKVDSALFEVKKH